MTRIGVIIARASAVVVSGLLVLTACSPSVPVAEPQVTSPASTQTPSTTRSFERACDRGPSDSAAGAVETDADGTPIAYTVAEGDSMWGIENRLCVDGLTDFNNITGWILPGDRLSLTIPRGLP